MFGECLRPFFLLFVISSVAAGVLVLLLTPLLKRLIAGRE